MIYLLYTVCWSMWPTCCLRWPLCPMSTCCKWWPLPWPLDDWSAALVPPPQTWRAWAHWCNGSPGAAQAGRNAGLPPPVPRAPAAKRFNQKSSERRKNQPSLIDSAGIFRTRTYINVHKFLPKGKFADFLLVRNQFPGTCCSVFVFLRCFALCKSKIRHFSRNNRVV